MGNGLTNANKYIYPLYILLDLHCGWRLMNVINIIFIWKWLAIDFLSQYNIAQTFVFDASSSIFVLQIRVWHGT